MADFQSKYSGEEIDQRLGMVETMSGATAAADGKGGLVPAPGKDDRGKYLKGDGTWGEPVQSGTADDAFLAIIGKFIDGTNVCTQEDYNTLLSFFDDVPSHEISGVNRKCKVIMPSSESFTKVIPDGGMSAVTAYYNVNDGTISALFSYNMLPDRGMMTSLSIIVRQDLSLTVRMSGVSVKVVDSKLQVFGLNGERDGLQDFKSVAFEYSGDGSRYLNDKGVYSAPMVNVAPILMDNGNIVSSVTEEEYSALRKYIRDGVGMYISAEVGSDAINFTIMSSAESGGLNIAGYDVLNFKPVRIFIDPDTYVISVYNSWE